MMVYSSKNVKMMTIDVDLDLMEIMTIDIDLMIMMTIDVHLMIMTMAMLI